jgi:hypothetical protein
MDLAEELKHCTLDAFFVLHLNGPYQRRLPFRI